MALCRSYIVDVSIISTLSEDVFLCQTFVCDTCAQLCALHVWIGIRDCTTHPHVRVLECLYVSNRLQ